MYENASNPEFGAVLERLRTFVDKEVLIEVSSIPDREGDVLALSAVICRAVEVQPTGAWFCLRSAGGHDLGQLSIDPERIGSVEADTTSVGFELSSTFVRIWDHKKLLEGLGEPLDRLVDSDERGLAGGAGLLESERKPADEDTVGYAEVVGTLFGFVGKTVRVELGHEASGGAEVSTFPEAMVCAVEAIPEGQGSLAGAGVRLHLGRNDVPWTDLTIYEQLLTDVEKDGECLSLALNGCLVRISGPKPSMTMGPDF